MAESELTFVEHDGHRLACIAHENPEAERLPVVWIHGLTMSVRFWEEAMYSEIEAHRSWYSVSLPFHYPSEYTKSLRKVEFDERRFAELVAAAIDELIPAGKFHIVGHSLGGFAALNYAAKFPDRVASIVSIGGFASGRARGLESVLQYISAGNLGRKLLFYMGWIVLKSSIGFLKLATVFYARRWFTLLRFKKLEPTLEAVFPDVQCHKISEQRALCRFLIDMNVLDEVESLQHPVLVMTGTRDPVISSAHQKRYAECLPNATLELFRGAGHVIFAEAPKKFEKTLLRWLDEIG